MGHVVSILNFELLTLKTKVILPPKMGLFWNSGAMQFRTCKVWQNHTQAQQRREECYFMEKEEAGRGCFEGKATGENQGFRVM